MIVLVRFFNGRLLYDLRQRSFYSWDGSADFFPIHSTTWNWVCQTFPEIARTVEQNGNASLSPTQFETILSYLKSAPEDPGVFPVLCQNGLGLADPPESLLLDLNRHSSLDRRGYVEVFGLPDSVCSIIQSSHPSLWQELVTTGKASLSPQQADHLDALVRANRGRYT